MRTIAALLVLLCLCAGCAVPLRQIDSGEELAILADGRADPPAGVVNTGIASGAVVGGGTGLIAGFLIAGACGPFAMACLPASMAAMGVTGAVAGGTVGWLAGLPEEKAQKLAANIKQATAARDPQRRLVTVIETRARTRWNVVPPPARNTIHVKLESVDLRAAGRTNVALAMKASILLNDKDDPRPITRTFEYLGEAGPVDAWLDDRDGFVANSLERGYAALADNVMAELSGPPLK